jgi:gamma-glutamylcyclotransferase (GGCT)/AIG2-like uncharacterized protein YtfP
MIQTILSEDLKNIEFFLKSKEFRKFCELTPPIMDHRLLRQGNYHPDLEIPQQLAESASETHRVLKKLFKKYLNNKNDALESLKQSTRLLYIVRSNIAHGEKTPTGPDLQKIERDRVVSGVTIPLQFLLIDLLLNRPTQRIVSYGTLSPEGVNHRILSSVSGTWEKCMVLGKIEKDASGLSFFIWDISAEPIDAQLFSSGELPEKWNSIDNFEGSLYKRRLIPVQLSDQKIRIANIYLKNPG